LCDTVVLCFRQCHGGKLLLSLAERKNQGRRASNQQEEWSYPEQCGRGLERRTIEDKISVAADKKVNDLLVTHIFDNHLANFPAQVFG
jgi:hypothetical protein